MGLIIHVLPSEPFEFFQNFITDPQLSDRFESRFLCLQLDDNPLTSLSAD